MARKLVIHGRQRERPHGLQSGPRPGEAFTDHRVVDCTGVLGDFHQAGQLTRITDLLAEGGDTALEHQRAHRHPPAIAGRPDNQVGVGARIGEEHLVEFGVTGELDDGTDFHARLIQRHKEIGQTGVAR